MQALNAEILVEVQGDLAVRARVQAMTRLLEFALDRLVAVEFAIDDDARLAVLAGDGLISTAEIDDAQPGVAKRDAAVRRHPMAPSVRAAVMQATRGSLQRLICDRIAFGEKGDNSAHFETPPDRGRSDCR